MKHHLLWLVVATLTGFTGFFFGSMVLNPPTFWESTTMITCGGGNYSKDTFMRINEELDDKVIQLLGSEDANQCHVVIIPEISGYRTRIIADHKSPIYDADNSDKLSEWIMTRMDELQAIEYNAQQDGADEPATTQQLKPSGDENPNPESKPRPQ